MSHYKYTAIFPNEELDVFRLSGGWWKVQHGRREYASLSLLRDHVEHIGGKIERTTERSRPYRFLGIRR